jgi:predicted metal-dependent HD superfamily phosphohydrolase
VTRREARAPAAAFALAADPAQCRAGFGALLARADLGPAAAAEVARRYAEPHRAYHDAAHVGLLWLRHLLHGGDAGDRDMALAILFHDAVREPLAPDNAERSAALLAALVPGDTLWAQAAIRATADPLGHGGQDGRVLRLLDLDLTPLAETADVFARNAAAQRRECAAVSDAAWRAARRRALQRLAGARPLFRTRLGAIYEAEARANIGAEIAALSAFSGAA